MRDKENVITYNGVFVVGQSKEDISDCKGLRDVAMATKWFVLLGNSSVTLPTEGTTVLYKPYLYSTYY